MNVTLGANAQFLVEELLATGEFGTIENVVESAIGLLALERITQVPANINELLAESDADIAAGRVHDGGPELFERLREKVREHGRQRVS